MRTKLSASRRANDGPFGRLHRSANLRTAPLSAAMMPDYVRISSWCVYKASLNSHFPKYFLEDIEFCERLVSLQVLNLFIRFMNFFLRCVNIRIDSLIPNTPMFLGEVPFGHGVLFLHGAGLWLLVFNTFALTSTADVTDTSIRLLFLVSCLHLV